jgi:hypothetical protein
MEHWKEYAIGLSVGRADWRNVTIETMFEIPANPHHVSAAGLAFRARDAANASMVEIQQSGLAMRSKTNYLPIHRPKNQP